mgnify:CR=1 FL=1
MQIQVTHKDGEVFTASNQEDCQINVGRGEESFRPMELLLVGLASCSSIDVMQIFSKQKISISNYLVTVNANREEGSIPSLFTDITIHFEFTGDVPLAKAKRAIKLTIDKYCSVAAVLKPTSQLSASLTLNQVSYEI